MRLERLIQKLYLEDKMSVQRIQKEVRRGYACVRLALRDVALRSNEEEQTLRNERKTVTFNESQRQLILGSMLGDAGLYREWKTSNKKSRSRINTLRLTFAHSIKQLAYLEHKRSVIGGTKIGTRISGMGSIIKYFSFCHKPSLEPFAAMCHSEDDKKLLSDVWLSEIEWEALAYWFMDDGYLVVARDHPRMGFCTQCFSPPELTMLQQLLRQFGLDSRRVTDKVKGYSALVARHKPEAIRFMENVRPWIIPSMRYKIRYVL